MPVRHPEARAAFPAPHRALVRWALARSADLAGLVPGRVGAVGAAVAELKLKWSLYIVRIDGKICNKIASFWLVGTKNVLFYLGTSRLPHENIFSSYLTWRHAVPIVQVVRPRALEPARDPGAGDGPHPVAQLLRGLGIGTQSKETTGQQEMPHR